MHSLQLSKPHIIAMVGIPGAGKSQFAENFAQTFGAPRLSIDMFAQLTDDETTAQQAVALLLGEFLKTKQTLILDGATEKRVSRSELMRIARAAGYKVLFVWVQTDLATARARWMKQHQNEPLFENRLKQFSQPHPSEPCMVISGRYTYASQLRALLKRLAETQPAPQAHTVAPSRQAFFASRLHVD